MKKRLLSFMLACSLAVGMLAGCGSEKTNNGEADKDAVSDVDGEAAADEDFENNASEEIATEEEEEFFAISTYTLANRELHDFFQLYLGSWCKYGLQKNNVGGHLLKKPNTITNMLDYVSMFDNLRIVADYNDGNFSALYDGFSVGFSSSVSSAEYSCSVNIIDTNFGSEYIYREGTEAFLAVLAEVTYNITTYYKNGNVKPLTSTELYGISLVKSTGSADEWLIRKIITASGNDTRGYSMGQSGTSWNKWKGEDLINEDLIYVPPKVDVDWNEVEQAYEEYVWANDVPLYKCRFIYLNEDAIPELLIQKEKAIRFGIAEYVVLSYKDGNIYESSSFEGGDIMYKKYENLLYVFSSIIDDDAYYDYDMYKGDVETLLEMTDNDLAIKSQGSVLYDFEGDDDECRIDGVEYDDYWEYKAYWDDIRSDMEVTGAIYTSIHEAFAELELY